MTAYGMDHRLRAAYGHGRCSRGGSGRRRGRALSLGLLLGAVLAGGCTETKDRSLAVTVPLTYRDKLLYAAGSILPTLNYACTDEPIEPPPGSGAPRLLLDTAAPLTAFSTPAEAGELRAQPFVNGQIALASNEAAGSPTRFLLCDVPVLRSGVSADRYTLSYDGKDSGALGGVIGGDILSRYALSLRFRTGGADLQLGRSDIATSCQIDDAVVPFKLLGGELAVRVSDTVLTYPASRITVGACVEPLADPLVEAAAGSLERKQPCLDRDPTRYDQALSRVDAELAALVPGTPSFEGERSRLLSWQTTLRTLKPGASCQGDDFAALGSAIGDVVAQFGLHTPPYQKTGIDMRFALSTAVPELILSQTACSHLVDDPSRCDPCPGREVELSLPGLNTGVAPERGCRIKLGSKEKAALVVIARQRYLSPCFELARSRRQRYGLPQQGGRRTAETDCQAEACLENLLRDGQQASRRCGYTGPEAELACDDHRSPVSAYVELGGPDEYGRVDTLDALVVPDSAQILQSLNEDLRNAAAQVDGVLGVSVLERLTTTVDYPQSRLALSCRCHGGHTCRTYRGVTYRQADLCSVADSLVIPPGYARSICR